MEEGRKKEEGKREKDRKKEPASQKKKKESEPHQVKKETVDGILGLTAKFQGKLSWRTLG